MPDVLNWDDKPKDECGLFGIYGPDMDLARLTYFGLYALQHRGQESAGIAVTSGREIDLYKDMGLVAEVFNDRILEKLTGSIAIGHVRYSTTGSSSVTNAQPLVFHYRRGVVAVAHNGNLTNAHQLRQTLSSTGSIFQSSTDTEVICNLIARHGQGTIEEALLKCVADCQGAFSLLFMTPDKLIGLRDPHGFRPLCIGKMGNTYIMCSESCALDTVGAEFIRDVAPGEMVVIDQDGIHSIQTIQAREQSLCIFEIVYLARPDSVISGQTVYVSRQEMGRQLAREMPLEADMVISVPDSGTAAAMGYAEASGIPFAEGLMKNRYSGRTFIQPSQKMRDQGVRLKLNPIRQILKGKRIILVDDSIVRGTTSKQIVMMLRDAGVREVHMLVSSPPILHPCYYGIDTSGQGELIAARHNIEQIRQHIQADSLYYLSLEGLLGAMEGSREGFCVACFNGKYPVKIPEQGQAGKYALEEEVS
ncbi:MAG: amidophosphoribosyltransferase [Bacillota bacterium]